MIESQLVKQRNLIQNENEKLSRANYKLEHKLKDCNLQIEFDSELEIEQK